MWKKLIKERLIETYVGKDISIAFLKGLLNNVSNKKGAQILKRWVASDRVFIKNDKYFIHLSPKELNLLEIIKRGGPTPGDFGTKN